MAEERKIFQKCDRCGNWFDPDGPQCPYCSRAVQTPPVSPPAQPRRKYSPWRVVLWLWTSFAVVACVTLILVWLDADEPPTRATAPTIAAEPTPTLRPLCSDRRDELSAELAALLVRLTSNEVNIQEVNFALDDDHDGKQAVWIRFQAYKPGTGKYPKGQLFVDVDDVTCEIIGHEIFW